MDDVTAPDLAAPKPAPYVVPRAGRFATKTGTMGYRRLDGGDRTALFLHLDKLSDADRCARFGSETLGPEIAAHCARLDFEAMHVYGSFIGADLVGVAELRPQKAERDAAIVLSVDRQFRRLGIAAGLMGVALRAAESCGFGRRLVYCLPDNVPMRCMMARAGFIEAFHEGMVIGAHVGQVAGAWPSTLMDAAG